MGKDVDVDVDKPPCQCQHLLSLPSPFSSIHHRGGEMIRSPSFVVAYLRDTLAVLSSVQDRPGNATGVLSLQEQ